MDNWEHSTKAAGGTIMRNYPLNYSPGLSPARRSHGKSRKAAGLVGLTVFLIVASCAPPTPDRTAQTTGQVAPTTSAGPKRVTVAVMGDAHTIYNKLNPGNNVAGIDAIEELVHTGLTHIDRFGVREPRLARDVPTTENGLWTVFPDGRMETTWRLKPTARWHDGTPVTSDDLLFTYQLAQDRDLPIFRDRNLALVEAIEVVDPATVTVRWKQPYIDADSLFTYGFALPLPKHLLDVPFAEDKSGFLDLPYWTNEFVGAGAYKLQEFAPGSHVRLEANDRYVLGRPKIDSIEVRFIPDSNVMMSNLLAGAVDLTIGRTLSVDQSVQLREQWKDGRMDVGLKSWIVIYPQFINPTPSVVGDVQFRRALLHAIDRQQMADSLMAGLSSVAHNYLNSQAPEAKETDSQVMRYEYDPRKAVQMIEALGYQRGPDATFRDSSGQRLVVSMLATAQLDIHAKSMFAVAGDWQKVGVTADPYVVPLQLVADLEHLATYKSFAVYQNPADTRALSGFHSTQAPVPANSYVGNNRPRYMDPEFDALLDRYFMTIPLGERNQVLGRIVGHISETLFLMGLFYGVDPTLLSNRVDNVWARIQGSGQARNAHEWDIR